MERRATVAEVRDGRTYYGRVWTSGTYDDDTRPSIMNLGAGEGGVSILGILSHLRLFNGDLDAVVQAFHPHITRDDVEAAIAYYESAPDKAEIDERLAAEEIAPA
jgi:hypothetical protein